MGGGRELLVQAAADCAYDTDDEFNNTDDEPLSHPLHDHHGNDVAHQIHSNSTTAASKIHDNFKLCDTVTASVDDDSMEQHSDLCSNMMIMSLADEEHVESQVVVGNTNHATDTSLPSSPSSLSDDSVESRLSATSDESSAPSHVHMSPPAVSSALAQETAC